MTCHVDQFRTRAEECRQLADMAPKISDKSFWLRLAQDWHRLAEVADGAAAVPSGEGQGSLQEGLASL
jgi:hypothetical protein